MEILNKVHESNLVEWAKDKPEVIAFSGDLTASVELTKFRDTYPDRFFSLGMAEQNMLSWAGGMAREGFTPFVHTFAVFLYRRPLDQFSMSIAYPNLPVRLLGFLPGITTPGGVTHQAIDDIAILRGIPNVTIFETGDATDVESVLDAAQACDGPVYVRMLRGQLPRLFPRTEPLRKDKARIIRTGSDIALLSAGICTEESMRATKLLQNRGVSITHLHISTLKPFTDTTIVEALGKATIGIITMENHTVIGGLGTCVAEMMAENAIGTRLIRIGLQDQYAHGASQPYLMRKYNLDAMALVETVEDLVGEKLGISEQDLAVVRLQEAAALDVTQLEAL